MRAILIIALYLIGGAVGLCDTMFNFPNNSPLNGADPSTLPGVTSNGITLTAVSAIAPEMPMINEKYPEGAQSATLICYNGIGVNNPLVANADFPSLAGLDDANSESGALNFLETMTFCFDRSVVFLQIRVADLELGEQLTVSVENGPSVALTSTNVWGTGNRGNTVFTGSGLGGLTNYVIKRNVQVKFAFDTVNPLDRISNGNGSNLSGSPSVLLTDFSVDIPSGFGLGAPFAAQGSSTQAVIGCELWGSTGTVSLVWSTNQTTWAYTNRIGPLAPQLFTNSVMTNLSAGTLYYYAFFATNAAGTKVWSSTNIFCWTTNLYVSPGGSDTNSGLRSNVPLRTIKEALNRVEKMARPAQPQAALPPDDLYEGIGAAYGDQLDAHLTNLAAAVTIKLLPGTYQPDELLVIDRSIGGGIHFEGEWAPGAEEALRARLVDHGEDALWMDPPADYMPVISGGRTITNWTATTVNGVEAWMADLPDVQTGSWYFQQLFVDGRRAERSRWPKQGWFRMEEIIQDSPTATNHLTFKAFPGHVQSWTNLVNVEAVILHRWFEDRLCITNYNTSTRWVQLAGPSPDFDLNASHPVAHGAGTAAYYLDHVFETMSKSGEWYLNRTAGRLYYIPKAGETMAATRVVAPVLRQLFQVKGALSVNQYLWDVRFSKIAFMHTQADTLRKHDGTGNNPPSIGSGAVQFSGARAAGVEACLFGHMGEAGVEFTEQTMRGDLSCNMFRDMAGTAFLAWQKPAATITVQERTGFLQIHDNDVKGYGRFWHGNVGMLHNGVMYSDVEHNYVRDGYYSGIRAGAGGASTNNLGFANILRKNRIHTCGQGWLSDLGGIYVPGVCPYSIVEGNAVYDIQARDYTSPALYLDGAAQYWTVRNNWFYDCNVKNLNMKGWSLVITNNVIAHAGLWNVKRLNADDPNDPGYAPLGGLAGRQPLQFNRNIYLQEGGEAYEHSQYTDTPTNWANSDMNLFWDATGAITVGPNQLLSQWRTAEKKDLNSIEQDPLFVDPSRGDFRVPTNSPAVTQLGFVPFDNRDAGPRSNEWAAAGAVWYKTAEALPAWMPSDVAGLQCWLDAAGLSAGPLAEWDSKTPYSYSMKQFDTAIQPSVVPYGLRGLPVVRFSGAQWMGNHEYLWDARQYAGRVEDRPFTIFTVHRATGTVMIKGSAAAGEWKITTNGFCWGSTNAGASGTDWQVRAWQRTNLTVRYYEGGVFKKQTAMNTNFNTDEVVWLGGSTNPATGRLTGDVAEVLVYMGTMSSSNFAAVNAYLMDKWMPRAAPFIANDSGAISGFGKATLRAELTVSNTANVVFYWGVTDGGTNTATWEHAVTNAFATSGTVSAPLTNLSDRLQYYYRCFASNVYGIAWAGSTAAFKTLTPAAIEPALTFTNNLQLWLDANDLDGDGTPEGIDEQGFWAGTVSAWIDKSAGRYSFLQTNAASQPVLVVSVLNERPVLRFSAAITNWVANSAGGLGRFGTNNFAIFTVHKSSGGNTTVISKGDFGGSNRWDIGTSQNQLRWNSTNYLGQIGTNLYIRCYQRTNGIITYYENGLSLASSTANYDVTSTDPLYVGRRGSDGRAMDGDIAELLIYTGTVSSVDCGKITDYLGQKWLGWIPATSRGTPYEWLEQSGITANHDAQDEEDLDGDGFKTWQEYLAGTDPTSAASLFRLTGINVSGSGAAVSWYGTSSGSTSKWSMYVSTNLVTGGWTLLASNSIVRNPQNGTNTWTDTSATNKPIRFYRPGVLLQ